jgi:carboxypeptidase C (cathepsin A)
VGFFTVGCFFPNLLRLATTTQAYPKYAALPFFVFGESYAGHYVPSLSAFILNNNPSAAVKINLRGAAVGNGLVDPQIQVRTWLPSIHHTISFRGEK